MTEHHHLSRKAKFVLDSDERLNEPDPAETKERARFSKAMTKIQQGGHAMSVGGSVAWSPRHSSIKTKLPVNTPHRAPVAEGMSRLRASGGKIVANTK